MIDIGLLFMTLMSKGISEKDAKTLVCIAQEESKLKPKAINHYNRNGTKDYGLFQINSIWLKSCSMTTDDLLDVRKNIACAIYVYNKQGLEAWSTYNKCS